MKVAILMGSKSDIPVVEKAFATLKKFGVNYEARILSAHRTPVETAEFATQAKNNGFEVIIAAAGKAAHLAGVIAAHTTLPVIGLPILSSTMDGLDSLLSTVQMPTGIPVATVAINGGENAALLAVEILAIKYNELVDKLEEHKEEMRKNILKEEAIIA